MARRKVRSSAGNGVRRQQVSVLLVATPRQLRDTVAYFTRLLGHRIRTVASLHTALTTLERVPIDIVVADEDVGGLTLCRRIRRRAVWRHMYVVVLALLPTDADIARCHAAGADACLRKPFDLKAYRQALEMAVTEVMRRRSPRE
jgi:CheY-like chemotaxis protein